MKGKYKIYVVDLLHKPKLAEGNQIFAIPTLVRKVPEPVGRIMVICRMRNKYLLA